MAVKKVVKRPARAGAPKPDSDDNDVDNSTEFEAEEAEEETQEEVVHEVVTKRLVAPRVQGIVKTILSGIDEKMVVTFFSKVPEEEVCIVDTTNTEEETATITVYAHPWAVELANSIWEEIDVDAQDPNTVNVEADGWVCTYPMLFD